MIVGLEILIVTLLVLFVILFVYLYRTCERLRVIVGLYYEILIKLYQLLISGNKDAAIKFLTSLLYEINVNKIDTKHKEFKDVLDKDK
jgi:hypothetical protein